MKIVKCFVFNIDFQFKLGIFKTQNYLHCLVKNQCNFVLRFL